MKIKSLLISERGIAFTTVIWTVTLIAILGVTVSFMTQNQLATTQTAGNSTSAFDIAEAGIEQLLSYYGQGNFPTATSIDTVAVGYNSQTLNNVSLNGGSYTVSIMKDTDPSRSGNIVVTSKGTLKGQARTIKVSIRGVPQVFNYGVISNGALQFEGNVKGQGYALINGNVHANGSVNLEGSHVFMNTPTYNGQGGWVANPNYNPAWALTATGNVNPNDPSFTGNYISTDTSSVQFPTLDYAYYQKQANFTNQEVIIYSGSTTNWTVANFNKPAVVDSQGNWISGGFGATAPYTSAIVVFKGGDGDINITGSGTITATILAGTSQSSEGEIKVTADPGATINFVPAIGLAIVGSEVQIGGNVNIGTKDAGAIVIATDEFQIEGESKGKKKVPSSVTMWGSLVLGQNGKSNAEIELDGDNTQNSFNLNYTGTINNNLPAGWDNWGTTTMYKDNWKES